MPTAEVVGVSGGGVHEGFVVPLPEGMPCEEGVGSAPVAVPAGWAPVVQGEVVLTGEQELPYEEAASYPVWTASYTRVLGARLPCVWAPSLHTLLASRW